MRLAGGMARMDPLQEAEQQADGISRPRPRDASRLLGWPSSAAAADPRRFSETHSCAVGMWFGVPSAYPGEMCSRSDLSGLGI